MVTNAGGSTLTTGATSQEVMASRRGKRVAYSITNYGATVAYVNLSDTQTAAVGIGIPVYPGGSLVDSNSENYKCWQGQVTAVDDGAAGATTLSIWERVEVG